MPRLFYPTAGEPEGTPLEIKATAEGDEKDEQLTGAFDIRVESISADDRGAQETIWRRLPLTDAQRKIILAEYLEDSIEQPKLSRCDGAVLSVEDFENGEDPLPGRPKEQKE